MSRLIFGLLLCFTTAPVLVSGSQASSVQERIVTAAEVNGTWKSRGHIFKIWALGQQKLKVEFVGIYQYKTPSGWMANTGSGSGIARIEGVMATFRPNDLNIDEECKITMRFAKGKLIVEQEGLCGFGLNVIASGTYRKVSRGKPKFGEVALRN